MGDIAELSELAVALLRAKYPGDEKLELRIALLAGTIAPANTENAIEAIAHVNTLAAHIKSHLEALLQEGS
jgi:hypothetical protein